MLSEHFEITEEFIMMLSQAKSLCKLNSIKFCATTYDKVRKKVGKTVKTKTHDIESLLISALQASSVIQKSSKDNKENFTDFNRILFETVEKIVISPSLL